MAAAPSVPAATKDAALPVYPRMTPNTSESEEWWTAVDNMLNKSDHGWLVRGVTPPMLAKQTTAVDLTALTELTVPAIDQPACLPIVRHNQMIAEKRAENTARTQLLHGQLDQYAMTMASILAAALRPNAELLLKELEAASPLTRVVGSHDGYEMLKQLRAKKAVPSAIEKISNRFHEKQWETMRDEQLPNGCSSQQYAQKVNKLMKDHLPHFKTINLSGDNLGNALIDFMPRAVAQEGRALVRELTAAGTLDDSTVVINRCTEVVAENADVGVGHAVMAAALLPAGPQRAAAMVAAMLPVSVHVAIRQRL